MRNNSLPEEPVAPRTQPRGLEYPAIETIATNRYCQEAEGLRDRTTECNTALDFTGKERLLSVINVVVVQ